MSLVAQYEEKTQIQLLSKIFAAYNVLAMLVFIPWWGLYGAALASGSAQALKNLFVWWHVRRRAVWLNARHGAPSFSLLLWGRRDRRLLRAQGAIPAPAYVQLGVRAW